MKNKLIYICGPITGLPDENKPAFYEVHNVINQLGSKAINPHELFKDVDTTGFTHSDYMRYCLQAMLNADMIVTLDNWYESKGATMEIDLARKLDIPVMAKVRFIAEANYLINEEARTTSHA